MLLETSSIFASSGDGIFFPKPAAARWGVDSEYGRLTDVMLSSPPHLEIVPCNSVAVRALGRGLACCVDTAKRQHQALVRALQDENVRCHVVPPAPGMPDLSFTRDTTLMTPWGLIALNPSVEHRRAEVAHVRASARLWGIPQLGTIGEGRIEGGDVCLLRPGLVVIGWSGERTDLAGAGTLARLFESRGWQAILCRFEPRFLHLDTVFSVIDRSRAVACIEALEPAFIDRLDRLGIDLVPVTPGEVERLGANLLSLGDSRVLSSADNSRVNLELARLGYHVIAVDIDQFARCGGGIHCLTMPLGRIPG